ncbi:AraC family transcriptional regulator [Billgrantia sp. LNSP4103-1]|uniref:AraC family transcriptional regulator n=1 Tax=Billgrantia sp. LNSP4103-1 TaxID=3410266 RepID=UPI00403F5989
MSKERHRAIAYTTRIDGFTAMSLASDRVFPRHSHDQYGIGLITAGGHRSWSGAGQVDAVAGDIITVNPGEIHDGAPLSGAQRSWYMLYFNPELVRQVIGSEAFVELTRPALDDPLLCRLMGQLFHRLTTTPGDILGLEECCSRLLGAAFSRHGSQRLSADPGIPSAIVKVRQRLDDMPHRTVTLGELADMAGLSRYRLLRCFAQALGITPHAYLIQRRIQLARRLIAAGEPLSQAAIIAGFSDQSHMSRAFSRQFGLSPGRYRRALHSS